MNRYRAGGPSKATSTTVCQKCLKRGHYSYECTASQQDRPYAARPSRTQQLLDPKLAPKLTNDAPKDLTTKLSVAEILKANKPTEGQRDRSRSSSPISSDSDSVSTISTNRSRTCSPPPVGRSDQDSTARPNRSPNRQNGRDVKGRDGRRHARRRSTSLEHRSRSPPRRRRRNSSRSRTRSPYRADRKPLAPVRDRDDDTRHLAVQLSGDVRPRSLSPFSKRLALTKQSGVGP